MAINKVVYGGKVLIDLTGDNVTADKVLLGGTAHDKSGNPIEGECAYDVNSSDGTATVAEILVDKTAYARGVKLTGKMPNNGGTNGTISTKDGEYTIPMGFHDGSGKVGIDTNEKTKIIASNIKMGIEILGVTGSYGGEQITPQSKTATPSKEQQVITPDEGYDYLSQVTVEAIPYTETTNSAGGSTVRIG